MTGQATDYERRNEIIDACLNMFIEKGLMKTTSRDLGRAVDMQSSALYYYFKNKDEIVVACAEEAGIRLEDALISPIFKSLDAKGDFMDMTTLNAKELAPMMQFFTQVCTTHIYRQAMQPVLDRMKKRHSEYAARFAQKLECRTEQVAPYLYSCVAIVSNYMIFGEEFYYEEPLRLLAEAVKTFKMSKEKQKQEKQGE